MSCGFLPRLEELVRHEDTQVVRYVAGALQNLVAKLRQTERGSQLRYLSGLARSELQPGPIGGAQCLAQP